MSRFGLRYSLLFLLITVGFGASLVGLILPRNPWIAVGTYPCGTESFLTSSLSPDGTRFAILSEARFEDIREGPILIFPSKSRTAESDILYSLGDNGITGFRFQDDNTIFAQKRDKANVIFVWRRQFPEGWRGYYSRPEFWSSFIFGLGITFYWVRSLIKKRSANQSSR